MGADHAFLRMAHAAIILLALTSAPALAADGPDQAGPPPAGASSALQAMANEHLVRGAALERGREYGEALAHYRQALDYSDAKMDIYYRMGGIYNVIGDDTSSIVNYTLAIAEKPDFFEARVGRARACLRQGYLAQALRDLNVALKLQPRSAEALYQRGMTLMRMRLMREAYRDLSQAHQLDSRYPRPILNGDVAQKSFGA